MGFKLDFEKLECKVLGLAESGRTDFRVYPSKALRYSSALEPIETSTVDLTTPKAESGDKWKQGG